MTATVYVGAAATVSSDEAVHVLFACASTTVSASASASAAMDASSRGLFAAGRASSCAVGKGNGSKERND
jgi:hypothetical protein